MPVANDFQDAMATDHKQDLLERRREREAEYAFDAWNVAVAMAQVRVLEETDQERTEAAVLRLERLKRGHASNERRERPGNTSGWEAEQENSDDDRN